MKRKGIRRICSREHVFYKSSDCPVCPQCWSGYYRTNSRNDFPEKIPAPALRALLDARITKLAHLTKYSKSEIASLHGMGPKALGLLSAALRKKKLSWKK